MHLMYTLGTNTHMKRVERGRWYTLSAGNVPQGTKCIQRTLIANPCHSCGMHPNHYMYPQTCVTYIACAIYVTGDVSR